MTHRRFFLIGALAFALVLTIPLLIIRGGQTGAQAPQPKGVVIDGGGGDLAPYLVGYYRCEDAYFNDCERLDTVFRFINPTAEHLNKLVALFDADENLVGCYTGFLSPNDLEIDDLGLMVQQTPSAFFIGGPGTPIPQPDPFPREGVIKVVVLEGRSRNNHEVTIPPVGDGVVGLDVVSGLVGYAEYRSSIDGFGLTDTVELHGVPGQVLAEDLDGNGRGDELDIIVGGCLGEKVDLSGLISCTHQVADQPHDGPNGASQPPGSFVHILCHLNDERFSGLIYDWEIILDEQNPPWTFDNPVQPEAFVPGWQCTATNADPWTPNESILPNIKCKDETGENPWLFSQCRDIEVILPPGIEVGPVITLHATDFEQGNLGNFTSYESTDSPCPTEPEESATPTETPTEEPSVTPVPPSATPTLTAVPPSSTPTATSTRTPTRTPEPVATLTPTRTPQRFCITCR